MVFPIGDYHRTPSTPWITYALIVANVLLYLTQLSEGDKFTAAHAVTPYELTQGRDVEGPMRQLLVRDAFGRVFIVPADQVPGVEFHDPDFRHESTGFPIWTTLVTAMFLHGSPLHLLGNMLFLWIFGDNVEEALGRLAYLVTYLIAGVVGFLIQAVASPNSMIPILGASGAVAGVMASYLILFPMNPIRVLIFYFPADLPAFVVIGLWIVSQFMLGLFEMDRLGKTGGVAYLAHIGGFAVGMLMTYLIVPNRPRGNQPIVQPAVIVDRRPDY
jgi:membrane associated rhomboid family serine protease